MLLGILTMLLRKVISMIPVLIKSTQLSCILTMLLNFITKVISMIPVTIKSTQLSLMK